MGQSITVCLHEDRPAQIPGLKLLLLSLRRFCPELPIRLNFPQPPPSLQSWLSRIPWLTLTEERWSGSGSCGIKTEVLRAGLEAGAERCLWLDTDVLVRAPVETLLAQPRETLVATEDPWVHPRGSTRRAEAWRLAVGRELQGPINTAVLSVTGYHQQLMQRWQEVMTQDWYLAEQRTPVGERNSLTLNDEDALSALLASDEFANIPLTLLRHSVEVLHHHGAGAYGLAERWQTVRGGMPPFLHAMGAIKPWAVADRPKLLKQPRSYYERYYLEVSPYIRTARQYRDQMDEECAWMDLQTWPGKLSAPLLHLHPAIAGAAQGTVHRWNHIRQDATGDPFIT